MGGKPHGDKELTDAKSTVSRASRIENILRARFAPLDFALEDESSRHAGHAGARAGGETHYRLRMVSGTFTGQSRVARQRAVMQALDEEFATGLHALSLDLKTPAESDA
jgi:BolA protein